MEEEHTNVDQEETLKNTGWKKALLLSSIILAFSGVLLLFIIFRINQPSPDFPINEPIVIEPGSSMLAITEQLAKREVVRSERLLYLVLILLHEPSDVKASTYQFTEPITTMEVANRITTGEFDNNLLSVTLVEGERAATFGRRTAEIIPDFSAATFTTLAEPYEGQLWPDTYFVPPGFTEAELVELLRVTYLENIEPLQTRIASHPLSEREVINLASIVEREANDPESMRMIAGILQNRLAIDMALQADATIEYVLETPLKDLPPGQLATELRELDSPYNSYLYTGLPPTPIGNPGLEAIIAVLEPTPSDYFFYITGDDGAFYYAETLEQHNLNIARYLR